LLAISEAAAARDADLVLGVFDGLLSGDDLGLGLPHERFGSVFFVDGGGRIFISPPFADWWIIWLREVLRLMKKRSPHWSKAFPG